MNPSFKISNRIVGEGRRPYVIAEMSANHNGSIEQAKGIIQAAARCGADAIKLQTYRPDTLTIDSKKSDFLIQEGLWAGRTLYELYEWAHTPWDWHKELFDCANANKITIFSSPFDRTAVDFLEDLNAPAYKIASFEAVDLELIRYAASTGKPLLVSTGMANFEEIEEAVQAAIDGGCEELALLHCVSGYPAPASDYNLRTIPDLISRFGCVTGISDHTLSNVTAITAVSQKASIIEKHFTLDRAGGGPDDSFSIEPDQMRSLVQDSKIAWEALGSINYDRKTSESKNVKFRRSLYAVKNIRAGDVFSESNVRSIRPGFGLPSKFLPQILGTKAYCDIAMGEALAHKHIAPPN